MQGVTIATMDTVCGPGEVLLSLTLQLAEVRRIAETAADELVSVRAVLSAALTHAHSLHRENQRLQRRVRDVEAPMRQWAAAQAERLELEAVS